MKITIKFKFGILLVLGVLCSVSGSVLAQEPIFADQDIPARLAFDFSYHVVPDNTGENSELRVYTKIPYSSLIFYSKDNSFYAEYELSVEIYDKDGDLIKGETTFDNYQTRNYSETESEDLFKVLSTRLPVTSGENTVIVTLIDANTGNMNEKTAKIKIEKWKNDKLRITNIILLKDVVVSNDEILKYTPFIPGIIPKDGTDFFTYLEIISPVLGEEYSVETELKTKNRRRNTTIFKNEFTKTADDKKINIATNLTANDLTTGSYEINYKIKSSSQGEKNISKTFFVTWIDIPTDEEDLDLALDQMKYAFDNVMYEDLGKLSFEGKLTLFSSVWNKYDPTPFSPGNGFRERYYRRVRYANKEFTQYKDGWKTDRGMIYILFGAPNQVFYSDFVSDDINSQQWVYFNNAITFTFLDDHNTGDFQLDSPYDYEPYTRPIK